MYGLFLDRDSTRSLHFQLSEGLRSAVRGGILPAGEKLASTRTLAAELGISRNLVSEVYEQLVGEGYFVARSGSGTYVSDGLGWRSGIRDLPGFPVPAPDRPGIRYPYDFTPGIPDLESFPRKLWLQCENEALSFSSADIFHYGTPLGSPRLRQAVSLYLYRLRGLAVPAEKIIITAGTQQSLALLSLLDRDNPFAFENPGNDFARTIFAGAGHPLVPLSVDSQSLDPEMVSGLPEGSRVFVTPSHQFPTGALLPIQRRLALLKIAREKNLLILEDDYDSEFRFKGTPVPPLAGMDPERVIYMGTFSKVMAPGLRLGYMVIPGYLKERIREIRTAHNLIAPGPVQETMAFFMEKGFLERHIHRMKRIYRDRCRYILDLLEKNPPKGLISVSGTETGFHLYLKFRDQSFDNRWFDIQKEKGLLVEGDSCYLYPHPGRATALVLGYGNIADKDIEKGLSVLNGAIGK